jgi:hypothetical protein
MELQDGGVVGIFNYCDRWCERCSFTSHCRVFAHQAELQASLDPNLKAVHEAPPLPEDVPPPPPAWMQELIEEMNEACRNPPSLEEWERMRPRVPAEHTPIDARAKNYRERTFQWLTAAEGGSAGASADPRDVISWFHTMIAAKVNRALTKWPDADSEDDESDNDGSAKVALLGIDESHTAWLELVERGIVSRDQADSFIADLVWLGEALERVRPRARAFVRPAFDEPEAVARFLVNEAGR